MRGSHVARQRSRRVSAFGGGGGGGGGVAGLDVLGGLLACDEGLENAEGVLTACRVSKSWVEAYKVVS